MHAGLKLPSGANTLLNLNGNRVLRMTGVMRVPCLEYG